jgi:hypothetical protein
MLQRISGIEEPDRERINKGHLKVIAIETKKRENLMSQHQLIIIKI